MKQTRSKQIHNEKQPKQTEERQMMMEIRSLTLTLTQPTTRGKKSIGDKENKRSTENTKDEQYQEKEEEHMERIGQQKG
jgi:hypothetical protein